MVVELREVISIQLFPVAAVYDAHSANRLQLLGKAPAPPFCWPTEKGCVYLVDVHKYDLVGRVKIYLMPAVYERRNLVYNIVPLESAVVTYRDPDGVLGQTENRVSNGMLCGTNGGLPRRPLVRGWRWVGVRCLLCPVASLRCRL